MSGRREPSSLPREHEEASGELGKRPAPRHCHCHHHLKSQIQAGVGLPSELVRSWGTRVAQVVKCLPSAQVMIPGSSVGAQSHAVCSARSLLLPLPLLFALLVLSGSFSFSLK